MRLTEFKALRDQEPAFLLYFYNDTCGVCRTLWPSVEKLIQSRFPQIRLIRVDAVNSRELAGQLQMLSVPGMLLYMEGREYFRATGMISLGELEEKIARPWGMMFGD